MKKAVQYIPLVLIILLMSMPALQMRFGIFREKPLNGAFLLAEEPDFTKQKWESGEYQSEVEKYLKDHAGFRSFLVRLYNQLDYSLYRKANAEGATIGKYRQLYEYDYIRSWLAIDNPGESFIAKKLNRAKYVQEYLKKEKDIDLVIVFEPGKASYYPEYITRNFSEKKSGLSTYERYVQKANEIGLDYVDWQSWFLQMKPDSKYPLFPKYGTHWSVYGSYLALDSMVNLIQNKRGIALGKVLASKIETSRRPIDTDNDVAKTMNLLFQPTGEELAYPVISFDTTGVFKKPMVLVVADSYYWNIFNTRAPKTLFANEAYWYFNTAVYPEYYTSKLRTQDVDLRKEIEKQDVIFLMITERFVHKFDWTFIDNLYKLYTPDFLQDPVYDNINRIMMHAPWYADVIEKGRKNGITLEEALILDGRYLYNMDDTAGFMIRFGPDYYKRMIRNDQSWMAAIREKAKKENLADEEMLEKDALYIFKENYPDYFEINRGITSHAEQITADPVQLDSIRKEALKYRFDETEMLWLSAGRKYREDEIARISNAIMSDGVWLESVKQKSRERNILLEEMIRMDAAYVLDQKMK